MKDTLGPEPLSPTGSCGALPAVFAIPGVKAGAAPKCSEWMHEASTPHAFNPVSISSIKVEGPHT